MADTPLPPRCDPRPSPGPGRLAVLAGGVTAGALGAATVLGMPLVFASEIVQSVVIVVLSL